MGKKVPLNRNMGVMNRKMGRLNMSMVGVMPVKNMPMVPKARPPRRPGARREAPAAGPRSRRRPGPEHDGRGRGGLGGREDDLGDDDLLERDGRGRMPSKVFW
jgi:hypothetical protein